MTHEGETGTDIATSRGDMVAAISNVIVGLYKRHYGKGPTKARTYFQGDVITCILSGCLTRAEETLVEAGHEDAVDHARRVIQKAKRDDFVRAVEEITGRRVVAFMSGNQERPEMSAEVFVLEPQPRRDTDV